LPHYKIDALVRKVNTLRYDDREYIQSNLIEAYDQLMAFTAKHLPDKFYMEGDQRVSLRAKIFREVAANLIVHREYTSAHPATFIIYKNRVETQNANNPHGEGPIDPANFAPFSKNPTIAKFFIQLGRVDDLGSGILNVNRFIKEYAGAGAPEFIEGNTFKIIIPLGEGLNGGYEAVNRADEAVNVAANEAISEAVSEAVNDNVKEIVRERLKKEIGFMQHQKGLTLDDIKKYFNVGRATAQRDMKYLKDGGLVTFKGAAKTGKYMLTEKGLRLFKK
jgi:ATP-dependent DNA helicase RecG